MELLSHGFTMPLSDKVQNYMCPVNLLYSPFQRPASLLANQDICLMTSCPAYMIPAVVRKADNSSQMTPELFKAHKYCLLND